VAKFQIAKSEVGLYEETLAANAVDTVEFASNLPKVEVSKDDGAAIYFTVDGGEPSVKGKGCYYLPAGFGSVREVLSKPNQPTVVKLISAGTPTYSVAKVSD
jgi:hypothetical protein